MKDFLKYVFATITGIILLTVVMGILGAISLVGLAASSASTTKVEENSVFTLMLSGQLDERVPSNPLASLTGQVSENLGLDESRKPRTMTTSRASILRLEPSVAIHPHQHMPSARLCWTSKRVASGLWPMATHIHRLPIIYVVWLTSYS